MFLFARKHLATFLWTSKVEICVTMHRLSQLNCFDQSEIKNRKKMLNNQLFQSFRWLLHSDVILFSLLMCMNKFCVFVSFSERKIHVWEKFPIPMEYSTIWDRIIRFYHAEKLTFSSRRSVVHQFGFHSNSWYTNIVTMTDFRTSKKNNKPITVILCSEQRSKHRSHQIAAANSSSFSVHFFCCVFF